MWLKLSSMKNKQLNRHVKQVYVKEPGNAERQLGMKSLSPLSVCTTPLPLVCFFTQVRFHWIVVNITNDQAKVFIISDISVPVLLHSRMFSGDS